MTTHLYDAWADNNASEHFDYVSVVEAQRNAAVNTLRDVCRITDEATGNDASLSRVGRVVRAALERLGEQPLPEEPAVHLAVLDDFADLPF